MPESVGCRASPSLLPQSKHTSRPPESPAPPQGDGGRRRYVEGFLRARNYVANFIVAPHGFVGEVAGDACRASRSTISARHSECERFSELRKRTSAYMEDSVSPISLV